MLALHHCARGRERHAIVVSATEQGAMRLLATAHGIAKSSRLLAGSVADASARLLTWSNGSTLRCVPATDSAVRGWGASLVVVDEAALVGDDVGQGAARPIIASEPDGRFLMISSALRAGGAFFDSVRRGDSGARHVRSFHWSLEDCSWIEPSEVEAAREGMSPTRFAAEFLGQFAGGGDQLFTRQALDNATADFETVPLARLAPPARLIGAADWGATVDRSAVCAVARVAPVGGARAFAFVSVSHWSSGHPLTTGSAAEPGVVEEVAASPAAWSTFVGESNGLGQTIAGSGGMLWRLMRQRPPSSGGAARRRRRMVSDDR